MSDDKVREWWSNWMSMDSSREDALANWPKNEWDDLRCYVEKSAYDTAQREIAELKAEVEREKKRNDREERILRSTISSMNTEHMDTFKRQHEENAQLKTALRDMSAAIEENKKSSELGFMVYPLEKSILDTLTTHRDIIDRVKGEG